MRKMPEKILKVLLLQKKLIVQLLVLFKEESNALKTFDLETINRINKRKMDLIERTETVTRQRDNIFKEFSEKMLGMRKEMSVDSILVFFKKNNEMEDILDLFEEIEELSESLKTLAEHNQRLIAHAMETINGTVGSVRRALNPLKGYCAKGQETNAVTTGSIIAGSL